MKQSSALIFIAFAGTLLLVTMFSTAVSDFFFFGGKGIKTHKGPKKSRTYTKDGWTYYEESSYKRSGSKYDSKGKKKAGDKSNKGKKKKSHAGKMDDGWVKYTESRRKSNKKTPGKTKSKKKSSSAKKDDGWGGFFKSSGIKKKKGGKKDTEWDKFLF